MASSYWQMLMFDPRRERRRGKLLTWRRHIRTGCRITWSQAGLPPRRRAPPAAASLSSRGGAPRPLHKCNECMHVHACVRILCNPITRTSMYNTGYGGEAASYDTITHRVALQRWCVDPSACHRRLGLPLLATGHYYQYTAHSCCTPLCHQVTDGLAVHSTQRSACRAGQVGQLLV